MKLSIILKSVLMGMIAHATVARATTITFQQGTRGYTGTHDTEVRGATPDRDDGALTSLSVDSSDGGGQNHVLIRFENIFGSAPNQIPPGSVIIKATLTLRITDPGSANTTMNRMLVPWTEASTWNSMAEGITADDMEAAATPDSTFSVPGGTPYFFDIPLAAATLQRWLDGTSTNHGWAILPGGSNGVDFDTSEAAIVANRPMLTVVYGLPGQPVLKTFVPTPVGFFAEIEDSTPPAGVLNPLSVIVTLDGVPVIPQNTKRGTTSLLSYTAGGPFSVGSSHTVVITFADSAVPPQTQTETNTYVIGGYTVIPAEYAVTSVDTSKPGFRARIYQMDVPRGPAALGFNVGVNSVPRGERQWARGYLDPDTGQPYANMADLTGAGADGFFVEPGVLNWNQDAPAPAGLFSTDTTPAFEDKPVPGIQGSTSQTPTDNFVVEIQAYLQLKSGFYRMGVNGDDGFRLSVARSSGDIIGLLLGSRPANGDTTFDFFAPVDGFYPIRLSWWEGTGGAHIELYAMDVLTGERTLINDLTAASPIAAFRESSVTYPYISRLLPAATDPTVTPTMEVVVDLADGTIPVTDGSVTFSVNGTAITNATDSGTLKIIRRAGSLANLLPGGTNTASLTYSFTSGVQTVTVTNSWDFIVGGTIGGTITPPYVIIPPGNRVPAGSINLNNPGFRVQVHQLDRSGDGNQGNGGRYVGQGGGGNNMPRAEIQFANGYINRTNNQPYPNLADLAAATAGVFNIGTALNFQQLAANAGAVNPNDPLPGMPGAGTSPSATPAEIGTDNYVLEAITYLDLKPGAYLMSIQSDDGYLLSSAPNPRDTLGTVLSSFNGGSAATAPTRFISFVILEAGIYPFRLLFWEGSGGASLEWLSVDPESGRAVLVNDTSVAYGIKAYHTYTGPARPWVKFALYPMPSAYQNQHQQSEPGPIRVVVGSGNPADIANDSPNNRPFGDALGAIVADVGAEQIGMLLDGTSVAPTVTDIPNSTDKLVLFTPNPSMASGSTHTAGLVYAGTTNNWTFTVISNVTVAAVDALASSRADQGAAGFKVKVVQAASAQANTVARAEAQLAGTPASVAIPGPEADGTYVVTNIINWNVNMNPGGTVAEIGNFQTLMTGTADNPVPGIPGTGFTNVLQFENIAAEVFAYLDLPAGYQKFGVNGDDGWRVQIGTPGQTDGTILFTADRGAGARDIPFAFITPQAGLYPIRLVWYQGAGGGNLEFFTYGSNNQKIPINDRSNSRAIRAYYRITGDVGGPAISISRQATGSVRVTFQGRLQQSGSLSPINWQEVPGATSPFDVTVTGAERYYRAVSP